MQVEIDIANDIQDELRERYGYRHMSWFVRDAVRRLLREYGLLK